MHTTSLPIHRVYVITGIVRTVNSPAPHTVCCKKVKAAQSLPLIEKWEKFMLPNHSRILPIEQREFVAGNRVVAALEKVSSVYLQNEFRKYARNFLQKLTSPVLSTVALRSDVWQGLSFFFPGIVIGG